MRFHRFPLAAVLFALLFTTAAPAAHAQASDPPSRGPSLAFSVSGSETIGIWFPAGERLRVGVEAGLRWERLPALISTDDEEERTHRQLNLSLPLRYALSTTDVDFAPYLIVGPSALISRGDAPLMNDRTAFGGFAGFGVDWFPVQRISIGGHVGVQGVRGKSERSTLGIPPTPSTETTTDIRLSTFSSGIRVNIYLR